MGESISLLQGGASSSDVHAYLIELFNFEPRGKFLASNKLFKTIKCVKEREGIQIVKLYIKRPDSSDGDLGVYERALAKISSTLSQVFRPNLITGDFFGTDKVGAICRQFFSSSLQQRFVHHPELKPIENLWLCYQLMQAVKQLHNAKICHGDIKAENAMLTSWQWLFLTDISGCYKPTFLDEANLSLYKLFFQTKREFCYLAPERFYTVEQGIPEGELQPSMDIFSLGCVVAEILLGGEVLFTHPQLLSFRKGEHSPDATLAKIDPELADAQQLIKEMIQIDPARRESIDYYCEAWEARVFPQCFPKLFSLFAELVTPESNGQGTDQRLAWFRCHFESIRKHVLDKSPACALLVVNFLCSMLRNTSKASSRIEVIEYLKFLIPKLSDEERMHRLLPYLIAVITVKEEKSTVKISCLNTIIELLISVNSLTSRDTAIFNEYIWPSLTALIKDNSEYVRATFAKHLATLAEIAKNFIEFSRRLLIEHDQSKDGFDRQMLELRVKFHAVFKPLVEYTEKPSVQEQLIKNLPQLCEFFGRQFTTSNILPLIFPYLSKSRESKVMLLKRIPQLIIIIGPVAFEKYIIPCIEGLFKDPDETVLENAIEVLAKSFSIPAHVLLKYAIPSLPCLVHPNQFVRNQVIELLKNIIKNLELADNYCKLRPHLLPYLNIPSRSIFNVTEETLEFHIIKSARRQVYDAIVTKQPLPELLPHEELIKDFLIRFAESLNKLPEGDARKRTKPAEAEVVVDRKRVSKMDMRQSVMNTLESFCPTGKLLCCLNEHKSSVTSLAVSPNNRTFASSSKDGAVKIWRLENIESFRSLNSISTIQQGQKKVRKILFYEDDSHLAVTNEDSQPRIAFYEFWASTSESAPVRVHEVKDEGVVMDLVSIDKNTLGYVSQLGVLHIYDTRVKKDALKYSFGPHRGLVTATCMGTENKSVIMGTASGYLMIYDIRFNALSRSFLHSRKGSFTSLSMFKRDRTLSSLDHINANRDTPLLLTATESGEFEVALWDLTTGRCGLLLALKSELPMTIPYLLEEDRRLVVAEPPRPILLNERMTKPILGSNIQHQRAIIQKYTSLSHKINDVLEHWNHFSSKSYELISAKKVLCPMYGGSSVPYVVSGSSDAIIRYWDLRNPRSSKVVAMQDFKSNYSDQLLGDVRVVQEKEWFSQPSHSHQFSQFSSVGMLRSADKEEAFVTRKYLHSDDINDLAFIQGTSTYLMSGSRDGSVRLWR
mmetsp:Transcript_13539/g.25509  ORF Transcript_13539/g.25509 Transcript_13539/m.25509 type:complete len:1228 (+) Transcript_13539:17-3700(+)